MRNEINFWDAAKARALAAPIPARTSTYSPVTHTEIMDAIRNHAVESNLEVIRERTHANMHGTRVVGFYDVQDSSDFENQHGLKMMFAYRNSYDKSMSVGFAAGASVWICGNGMISGDLIAFRRKHTGTVAEELANSIQVGVNRMKDDFGRLNMEVDVMKNYDLTPRQKAEVLGVMYFEQSLVTPTQLSIVKHELNNSEHFRENNLWHLYNNVTESLKKSHPVDIIPDHIKVHSFFKGVAGMNEPQTEAISEPESES